MELTFAAAARDARGQGRRPLVTTAELDGWVIETWRESRRAWLPDVAAAEMRDEVVRLVVADPAENALVHDASAHSARAASAVWHYARLEARPCDVLRAASASVCDPARRPRHRNPLAAAAVVDIDAASPRLRAGARCADGDLWTRGVDGFDALTGTDMLTGQGRARLVDASTSAQSGVQRWEAQEASLDDPDMWNHHSVGLVTDPTVELFAGCVADAVVLSTDGARLEPRPGARDRVERLGEWLSVGITEVGDDWPHPHPFGDLGVVRARWVGPSPA
jgi:hypothetical protein